MIPAKREAYPESHQYTQQEHLRQQEQQWEREAKRVVKRETRSANAHIGLGRQVGLVMFVLSVAAVCLALVGGYERLAVAHQANVKLKSEIKTAQTYIEDLSVELEYAMDPITVQKIAEARLGMDYPKLDQLVKVAPPKTPAPSPTPAPEKPAAAATPEPSFVMPEVERTFKDEDFEIIGFEE